MKQKQKLINGRSKEKQDATWSFEIRRTLTFVIRDFMLLPFFNLEINGYSAIRASMVWKLKYSKLRIACLQMVFNLDPFPSPIQTRLNLPDYNSF